MFLWILVEEQLLRSVEGQAASDEEEEKWSGEQQQQISEVKRILSRLSCCGERYGAATAHTAGPPQQHIHARLRSSTRCDSKAFKRLMSNSGGLRSEESCSAVVLLLERVTRLQKELELKESQDDMDVEQVCMLAPEWCFCSALAPGSSFPWTSFPLSLLLLWLCDVC